MAKIYTPRRRGAPGEGQADGCVDAGDPEGQRAHGFTNRAGAVLPFLLKLGSIDGGTSAPRTP